MTHVTLLWLESTRPGTAARTHLRGTITRLDSQGIEIVRTITDDGEGGSFFHRVRRLVGLIREARNCARSGSVLVARWHPLLAFVTPRWLNHGRGVVLLVQGTAAAAYESNPWLRKVPFIERIVDQSVRNASSWLALNEGVREWLRQAGVPSDRIAILETGVDPAFASARVARTASAGGDVVFFGSLTPWQGLEDLLAATQSAEWPVDRHLTIVGDGPLASLVADAPSERVTWLGRLEVDQTARVVAEAVCTVCPKRNVPSMAESTTPFKVLESVAAGVPVVVTDIPAQRRMIETGGYGVIARERDPDDLARQIARLTLDSQLRDRLMSNAERAAARLTWAHGAPQLGAAVRNAGKRTDE